ncbi:MFS transporter [Chloroflexota bacterium]
MKLKNLYYGWIIVFISLCILATNAIAITGFGLFLKPLIAEFGWERGPLSGAFSVAVLIGGVLTQVSGRMSDRFGPRILVTVAGLSLGTGFLLMSQISALWQVYLVWGLFIGITIGCSVVPIRSTIPRWFAEKRGLTMAIPVAGFSLGGIITPLFVQWLISTYGWQLSFFILGFIPFAITVPLAQFLKRDPQQIGLKPYGEGTPIEKSQSISSATREISFTQAIKTGRFWSVAFIQFVFGFCIQTIFVHLAPHSTDVGLTVITAASIISIFAACRLVGNLAAGFFSDRIGGRLVLSGCLVLFTLALAWLLFTTETWMFYVFAVAFGLASGGIIPLLTVVPAELFGLRHLGAIFGFFFLFDTSGGMLGSPLAGLIFDINKSYHLAFGIDAIVGTLAIILSLILLRYKSK